MGPGQARFYSMPKFLLILSSTGGNIFESNNSILSEDNEESIIWS